MVTGKSHKPTKFARFVLYPIGGAVFFVVLTIILTMANGYRFTYNSGKVSLVRTGMLIISSRPFDGQILLNGKTTKFRTGFYLLPTKISALAPGSYDVEVKKTGYRTWSNRLDITPNIVTWANYVLLFADKLNINKIVVPAGTVTAQSQNGRHVLYADKTATSFSLKSWDTNNLSVKDFWPPTGVTDPWLASPQLLSSKYSTNNDRALLTVQNADRVEYVVVDATSAQPKLIRLNINLGKNFSEAWWSLANNSDIYLREGVNIYLVNINDTSLGNPVISDVVSLSIAENHQIFYVTKNATGTYSLGRMSLDGNKKETLAESVAPSGSYKIDFSAQNNIVSVLNNDTKELNAYYIGSAVKKYTLKMSSDVLNYSWSKNGQKLNYYGSNFVKRYDWEKSKEVAATLTDKTYSLEWYFDENHYFVTSDKGVYVVDYDGTNKVLVSGGPTVNAIMDQGNNNIIYSTKDDSGLITFYKYISEF